LLPVHNVIPEVTDPITKTFFRRSANATTTAAPAANATTAANASSNTTTNVDPQKAVRESEEYNNAVTNISNAVAKGQEMFDTAGDNIDLLNNALQYLEGEYQKITDIMNSYNNDTFTPFLI
jgi:hypothetical protein